MFTDADVSIYTGVAEDETGQTYGAVAVSYTHLDVYKRQL